MFKKVVFNTRRLPGGIPVHTIVGWLTDQSDVENIDLLKKRIIKTEVMSDDTAFHVFMTDAKVNMIYHDAEDGEDPWDEETIEMTKVFIGYPFEKDMIKLITVSPLASMFPCDFDGDLIDAIEVDEILSEAPVLRGYCEYPLPEGTYNVRNKFLYPMKEYAFDRDVLTKLFSTIVTSSDKALERIEDVMCGNHDVGDFRIWRDEDEEFYILHVPSGTIIGWYKFYHYGRCNFCNKPDMAADDLRDFFMLLRNQLLEEPDEPEEQTEYHPQVKVTETDHSKYEPTEADVEKAMRRITINSIYGSGIGLPSLEDIASMHPKPENSVHMEKAWKTILEWASNPKRFRYSQINDIKGTISSLSGESCVWLVRHHDFIQLLGDIGEEIMIGYERAEYSYSGQYGRQTCREDPDNCILFRNPIINSFYKDFFAHGPVKKEYDFYKKYTWEEDDNNAKDCDDR